MASHTEYSQTELDDIQARWDLRFPPDLIDLLRSSRLSFDGTGAFDWVRSDPSIIQHRLEWPFESFWFDVTNNAAWWPEWGDKPSSVDEQRARLKEVFALAPKLIPLFSHRYLPEQPFARGNPVFSVYQTDVICYGADLQDWIERERGSYDSKPWPPIKEIPFWSEALRKNNAAP